MKTLLFPANLTKNNIRLRNFILKNIKKYKYLSESTLLDVGCGNGRFASLLSNSLKKYYGIDPDKKAIEIAKRNNIKNALFKVGKGEKIPLNQKFDIVLYSFSWHFIKDFKKALNEMLKVSKPDSLIVVLEPSQKPKGYLDQRLNKASKSFDKQLWLSKLKKLKWAERELKDKRLNLLAHKISRVNLWLFSPRGK